MIDFIPSKTVRDYIEKEHISFRDEEWATIIYNIDLDVERIHALLKKIAEKTVDEQLKQQIQERIAYDNKCLALKTVKGYN